MQMQMLVSPRLHHHGGVPPGCRNRSSTGATPLCGCTLTRCWAMLPHGECSRSGPVMLAPDCAQDRCRTHQQTYAMTTGSHHATNQPGPPEVTCATQQPLHASSLSPPPLLLPCNCSVPTLTTLTPTLTTLTPTLTTPLHHRNKGGYETSEMFKAKFTHVVPVWYQLKYKDGQFVIQGGHDVNTTWVRELQKPYADVSTPPCACMCMLARVGEAQLHIGGPQC